MSIKTGSAFCFRIKIKKYGRKQDKVGWKKVCYTGTSRNRRDENGGIFAGSRVFERGGIVAAFFSGACEQGEDGYYFAFKGEGNVDQGDGGNVAAVVRYRDEAHSDFRGSRNRGSAFGEWKKGVEKDVPVENQRGANHFRQQLRNEKPLVLPGGYSDQRVRSMRGDGALRHGRGGTDLWPH